MSGVFLFYVLLPCLAQDTSPVIISFWLQNMNAQYQADWNGLLELVRKLKAAGITPIALGEGEKWTGHFWWTYLACRIGGKAAFDKAISGKGSFADDMWVKAGRMLKQLVELQPFQESFLTDNHNASEAILGNGEAAMLLMGYWAAYMSASESGDHKGLGDKPGFANFPTVEEGAGALTDCIGGGNGFVLGKNVPDEAVEFLKYITSVDVQKRIAASVLHSIPTVPGAETVLADPNMITVAKVVAAADYFQLYYEQFFLLHVGETLMEGTYGILTGNITPEQCALMVSEAYQKSLSNE